MDKAQLSHTAQQLLDCLTRYARADEEISGLLESLDGILRDAIAGRIDQPLALSDVPGAYLVVEGSLIKYPDLGDAYARFNFAVTGDDARLKRLSGGT